MKLLHDAVESTLVMASYRAIRSVSIPAISSGIFGFPKPLCAKVLFGVAEEFALKHRQLKKDGVLLLELVRFTNFDTETTDIFKSEFKNRYPISQLVKENSANFSSGAQFVIK